MKAKIIKRLRNNADRIKVRVPQISKQNSTPFGNDCKSLATILIKDYSNFNQSAPPERFMCFEDDSWVDLKDEDAIELVRSSFVERKPMVEVLAGGSRWLIDFYRMVMVNFDSKDVKSVAWIDVHGKCFFPMRFVSGGGMTNRDGGFGICADNSCCTEVPRIEIEINVNNKRSRENFELESDGNSSCDQQSELKRKVVFESPESKKRKLYLSDCESPRWPKTKLLKEEEKPYQTVKKLFLSGSGLAGAMITGIHRVSRTDRFDFFQKQIEKTKTARGGDAHAIFAWHGTSAKGVESILANGFGMPSKVPNSEAHGVGIYLSPVGSPHIGTMLSEVDPYGERHAILCRIILGKCEKVEAGSQQSYPSSVNFDTGVDDIAHPKWYIVWCANMKTHLLPECVVSYRLPNEVPGRLDVPPVPRLMQNGSTPSTSRSMQNSSTPLTTMLLPRLKSSLPAPKVLELQTLYGGYKNGKLPKDIFIKELRSIVGDETLLSALREIRVQA